MRVAVTRGQGRETERERGRIHGDHPGGGKLAGVQCNRFSRSKRARRSEALPRD